MTNELDEYKTLWQRFKETISLATEGCRGFLIFMGSVIVLIYFVQMVADYFNSPLAEPRWYEQWGLYHHKVTQPELAYRILGWDTEKVQELLGKPIYEEKINANGAYSFYWKYQLELKSEFTNLLQDRDVYIYFWTRQDFVPEGQTVKYEVAFLKDEKPTETKKSLF